MASPLLVIIQGVHGSGKTTLAERLRHDVPFPVLGKDDIKELLFDNLEQSDREFSRLQGMASFGMLYAFARTFLENGQSVVIEAAFETELSRQNIKKVLSDTHATCLELFCHVDDAVRRERITSRMQDSSRHEAHMDSRVALMVSAGDYLQLNLGECIDIDMTDPISDEKYAEIINGIQEGQKAHVAMEAT